jgi:hypothetical protein
MVPGPMKVDRAFSTLAGEAAFLDGRGDTAHEIARQA